MIRLTNSIANSATPLSERPLHTASPVNSARFALPANVAAISATSKSASAGVSAQADDKPADSQAAAAISTPAENHTADQTAQAAIVASMPTARVAAPEPDQDIYPKPDYTAMLTAMPPHRASIDTAKSDSEIPRSVAQFDVTLPMMSPLPAGPIANTVAAAPFSISAPIFSNAAMATLPAMDGSQAVIQRMLDTARGDLWLTEIAHDIAASRQSNGRLSFTMQPENLGKLAVDIAAGDTGMSLEMTASSDEAAILIAAGHTKLVDELRAHNIRISETDIQTRSDSSAQDTGQHDTPEDATKPDVGQMDIRAAAEDDEPHSETGEDRAAAQHGRFA